MKAKDLLKWVAEAQMNSHQKTAVFLLRLIGFSLAFIGGMALAWFAIQTATGVKNAITRGGPWPSVLWLVAGVVVYGLSKPIGKRLGSGLD